MFLVENFDKLIEIFTTKMGISCGGKNLKHTILNRKKRHIKCPPTKIKYHNLAFSFALVQSVGHGRSSRFIDDSQDIQSTNRSRIFCRLTLLVVEVSGDSDNRVSDLFTQVGFGDFFHFGEDHSRDFFGSEDFHFTVDFDFDSGFAVLVDDLEGEMFDIVFYRRFVKATTDETSNY